MYDLLFKIRRKKLKHVKYIYFLKKSNQRKFKIVNTKKISYLVKKGPKVNVKFNTSDPPSKGGNSRFTTVPLKALSDQT